MFGWKRLWHKLLQLMSQTTNPEATMQNSFQSLQTATGALPLQLGSALANAEDAAFGELALTHFETLSWYLAPYAYFLAACAHPYNAIVCMLSVGS